MFPPNLMISMFASQCARPVPVLNSPYLCVGFLFPTSLCGVLAFDSVSRLLRLLLLPPPPPPLCHTPSFTHHLSHTIFLTPSHSHNFVTHHLTHATLSHTIFLTPSHSHNFVSHHLSHTISLTQLCHTPSFSHHLTHTTLSHTIFHTQLCHPHHLSHTTLSPTIFNFVTHHLSPTTLFHPQLCHTPSTLVTHHLSHTTLSPTTLSHTTLSHTIFHKQLSAVLCVAGVPLDFAWQACHLVTSTLVSRGRRGTWGTVLALVARFGRPGRRATLHGKAWHLVTSTFVFRGRRGT